MLSYDHIIIFHTLVFIYYFWFSFRGLHTMCTNREGVKLLWRGALNLKSKVLIESANWRLIKPSGTKQEQEINAQAPKWFQERWNTFHCFKSVSSMLYKNKGVGIWFQKGFKEVLFLNDWSYIEVIGVTQGNGGLVFAL